jgi:hypothetical protein
MGDVGVEGRQMVKKAEVYERLSLSIVELGHVALDVGGEQKVGSASGTAVALGPKTAWSRARSRYCGPFSAPPFHATMETSAGASVTSARKAIAMALAVRMPKSKMKLI